jgi:rhodanese-related sulfurtransferase
MPKSNQRKKLFLEMGIIVLIAAVVGLIVNRRMLLDISRSGASSSVSPPVVTSSTIYQVVPASLIQVRELYEKNQAILVDARDASAFESLHIRDAVSLPVADAERKLPEFKKRYTTTSLLIVYCSGYGCRDSRLLAEKLQKAGYVEVLVYEGGLPEWQDAGLPVEGTRK